MLRHVFASDSSAILVKSLAAALRHKAQPLVRKSPVRGVETSSVRELNWFNGELLILTLLRRYLAVRISEDLKMHCLAGSEFAVL